MIYKTIKNSEKAVEAVAVKIINLNYSLFI